MQFRDGTALYSYETQREGGEDVLYVNYLGAPFVPSIADSPEVMERTIDALMENPNVSRVVFVQQKNYNYNFNETSALLELAHAADDDAVMERQVRAGSHRRAPVMGLGPGPEALGHGAHRVRGGHALADVQLRSEAHLDVAHALSQAVHRQFISHPLELLRCLEHGTCQGKPAQIFAKIAVVLFEHKTTETVFCL